MYSSVNIQFNPYRNYSNMIAGIIYDCINNSSSMDFRALLFSNQHWKNRAGLVTLSQRNMAFLLYSYEIMNKNYE